VSDAAPVLALAADEAYALPLSVVVGSALDHLAPGARLELFVLDGGLRAATRRRLEAAWTARGAQVEWLEPGGLSLHGVKLGGHISVVTYFRILLPHVLPERIHRAIYLDCDVLVLGDLAELWATPLDGRPAAAVQDPAAPYLDTAAAFPELAARSRHILDVDPVANYRELGLAPDLPYCNAGTLLMDVAAWRAEDIPQRILDCLTEQRRFVRFWDQYGINVVLAGRLTLLEPRWNVSCYLAEHWDQTPFDAQAHASALARPGVVHFLGPDKPWQLGSRLRWVEAYRTALAATPWTPAERLRLQAAARWGRERRRLRKRTGRLRKRTARLRKRLRRLR
jgi:lipopolysaccharide biosynthesis glycosyltransferase